MKQDNSPEPQTRIALPPLSEGFTNGDFGNMLDRMECEDEDSGIAAGVPRLILEGWAGIESHLRQREEQLYKCMQSLARIHALALDLQRGTNVVPMRAVVDEIARLSNANAAAESL